MARVLQGAGLNIFEFSVIQYISLIYLGIGFNLTPLVTLFVSFYLTGETFKKSDYIFLAVSFTAVSMITYGNWMKN